MSSRKMLVVLDNAADEAQVRPLLPGRSSAGVLITSRARLSLLEGVYRLNLDILPLDDALELLTRLVGEDRAAAESEAARKIVDLCGRLPLAVRIAGAKLAANEHWALAKLARRLKAEERRLDELSFGDREVRSSFASSYDDRPLEEQRLFRLLGLIQAPSFASWVAAALLDTDLDAGEDVLDNLVQAQLVEVLRRDERGWVRYRFHDLLRVFAREQLAIMPTAERKAALGRLLGAYLSLAGRASETYGSEMLGDKVRGNGSRWYIPGLAESAGAVAHPLDWYVVEQKALMTAVEQASTNGFWNLSWELAKFMSTFFEAQSNWPAWHMTHEVALHAARRAGSTQGEAISLYGLATCRWYQSSWPSAIELFSEALVLFKEIGDLHSQARTLRFLGVVHRDSGQWVEALEYLRQALPAYEAVGDGKGVADTLRSIGVLYRDQSQGKEAAKYLHRALAAYQEMGERQWEARTFRILAVLHLNEQDPDSAIACLQKALPVLAELRDRLWEARALRDLASANMQLGNDDNAIPYLRASLEAFSGINDARGSAYTLENLGQLYAKNDRIAEAVGCFEEARESFKALNDLRGEAMTTIAIGTVHMRSGRLNAARPWYEHALVLVGKLGDRRREQSIRTELQRIDAGASLDR
jgi:tetratricopeptide (TPR) repeat protein